MEKGRFPDWQPEGTTPDTEASTLESDKKKKRRKKGAGSAQPDAPKQPAGERTQEDQETTEQKKVRKALADFFVEREAEGGTQQPGAGKRGESAEKASPKKAEAGTAADTPEKDKAEGKVTARPEPTETGKQAAEAEIGAAKGSPAEEVDPEADAHEDGIPEPERTQLLPNQLNGGEVVIELQGRESLEEREIPLHAEAVAGPAAEEAEKAPEVEPVLQVDYAEAEPADALDDGPETEEVAPQPEVVPEASVPTFVQQQSELQPQARAYEAPSPDEFVSTAAAPGPEVPAGVSPEDDPSAEVYAEPEPALATEAARRPEPAEAYRMYMQRQSSGGDTSAEPMVSKREADDAVYYATKGAQGRGLAAGLLVAALWARHRGKKLRHQFDERFRKQEKQLEQTREYQNYYAAEQTRRQAETDQRLAMAERRYMYAENQLASRARFEQPAGREALTRAQQERLAQSPEQQTPRAPEAQMQDVPERLNVPPEHRLETSAWHTIEVDARTGRPVEQPTFAYGHEYYRERSHESTPSSQRNAAAGEVALVGAAGTGTGSGASDQRSVSSPLTPVDIPSATMQGAPPGSPTAKMRSARDNLTKATANGPVWPYVVALLVIFFVLIALLG